MATKLMETALGAVNTYLQAQMAAKLNTLDAEYADGITLADIVTWYIAPQMAIPEYPAVLLLSDNSVITGEGQAWIRAQHQVTIVVIVADQDTTTLQKRLWRYTRAIIELLKAARESVGWAYTVSFNSVEFTPFFATDGQYLSDARVIIQLGSTEAT